MVKGLMTISLVLTTGDFLPVSSLALLFLCSEKKGPFPDWFQLWMESFKDTLTLFGALDLHKEQCLPDGSCRMWKCIELCTLKGSTEALTKPEGF